MDLLLAGNGSFPRSEPDQRPIFGLDAEDLDIRGNKVTGET